MFIKYINKNVYKIYMNKYNRFIKQICNKNLVHNLDSSVYELTKEDDDTYNNIDSPILQIVKDYSYNYVINNNVNKDVIKEYYEHDYGLIIDNRLFDEIEQWVNGFDDTEKWYSYSFTK